LTPFQITNIVLIVDPEGEGVQLVRALHCQGHARWMVVDGSKAEAIDEAMGGLHNGCSVAVEISDLASIETTLLAAAKRRRALSASFPNKLFFFCRQHVHFPASVQACCSGAVLRVPPQPQSHCPGPYTRFLTP